MWESIWQTGEVHVWPLNDLIAHESDNCVCLPRTEPVERDEDGYVGWVVIHNSWDNRERYEK
jgi:hypothetical protein